jgi:hypothetical protein
VLDRPVLVHLLTEKLAADRGAARAFAASAARVAPVSHPSVLQVFDIGEDPPFAVFEHAGGGRLADRLRAGPLGASEGARTALAIARALEALHERGTRHGSLSPECVLFGEEGLAKVLATGAADAATRMSGVDAAEEQPPGYRPPEADPSPVATDFYALAALTWHMFAGAPPSGSSGSSGSPAGLPASAIAIMRRALSPDPSSRPTLDEFVSALAPVARPRPGAREPRFRSSEFRWLAIVVVILGLGALAATVGVQFARELARRSEQVRPTTTPSAARLAVAAVADFDPLGDRTEHPEQAARAIDRDPRTSWKTFGYRTAALGGKRGVGLVFDLGTARSLRAVRVESTLPGWTAQIRIADAAGAGPEAFRLLKDFVASTDERLSLPPGARGRFVLLWITKVTDDGSGSDFPFRAEVAEVEFFA